MKLIFLVLILNISALNLFAQCPTNEADLADGGTFSGTCNIAVGANIVITGAVIWNSGTLSITGSNGDIDINGGSLTINAGTVRAVDGDNGDLDVISGSITIASGATLLLDESIQVFNGASITVSGTLSSQDRFIDIDQGGTITVNSTGTIRSSSTGGNENIFVQGTLINNGTVDSDEDIEISSTGTVTNGSTGILQSDDDILVSGSLQSSGDIIANDDIEVNGGTVVISGGTVDGGDDLVIIGGGSFEIASGVTVTINDDIDVGNPGQGSLVVDGTLIGGDDLTVSNTTPNSSLTGTGVIDITDNYNDAECPGTGDFCSCVGAAVGSCASALPVQLTSFTADQNGAVITLAWETASELNNDFFSVQRMNDKDQFTDILKVKGKGTTNQVSTYQVQDHLPALGKNYYRLKQTDFDGTTSYSKIKVVDYTHADGPIRIYPNPLRNQDLKLIATSLPPDTKSSILIRDIHGSLTMESTAISDNTGTVDVTIPTAGWSKGVYIIQLGLWKTKFIIEE